MQNHDFIKQNKPEQWPMSWSKFSAIKPTDGDSAKLVLKTNVFYIFTYFKNKRTGLIICQYFLKTQICQFEIENKQSFFYSTT
jgi:hypothetical protein